MKTWDVTIISIALEVERLRWLDPVISLLLSSAAIQPPQLFVGVIRAAISFDNSSCHVLYKSWVIPLHSDTATRCGLYLFNVQTGTNSSEPKAARRHMSVRVHTPPKTHFLPARYVAIPLTWGRT